ncbi:MAG TPA: carboxypeptidase-like regulatory domain-containing protein [Longimicrobiales bacterium]|nr:carboxypeptidase-like regulatory domain-containing protein [Longimicrobiales bacterium]
MPQSRKASPPGRQPRATSVRRLLSPVLATVLLALPGATRAQVVTGRVLDEANRTAIGAARVAALDTMGGEHASVLTDSAGRFQLPLAPGRYSLRLERIGYHAFTTVPLEARRRETITLELRLGAEAVPLEPC